MENKDLNEILSDLWYREEPATIESTSINTIEELNDVLAKRRSLAKETLKRGRDSIIEEVVQLNYGRKDLIEDLKFVRDGKKDLLDDRTHIDSLLYANLIVEDLLEDNDEYGGD